MTDAPLANDPEARTPQGEIKNQALPTPDPAPTPDPKTQTESGEPKAKETTPPKAPDAYTDFTLPDGVKLEGEALTKAQELFKSAGLTQEQAQSMVDFHIAQVQAAVGDGEKAITDMHAGWKTASEADPDIGPADGAKAKQIKESVGRALDSLNNKPLADEFKQVMNLTGVGDNPAFIKVISKLAQSIIEPRHVVAPKPTQESQTPSGTKERPTPAKSLYPNNP